MCICVCLREREVCVWGVCLSDGVGVFKCVSLCECACTYVEVSVCMCVQVLALREERERLLAQHEADKEALERGGAGEKERKGRRFSEGVHSIQPQLPPGVCACVCVYVCVCDCACVRVCISEGRRLCVGVVCCGRCMHVFVCLHACE